MNVLLVEDEQPAARRLRRLIRQVLPQANILALLDSVATTVAWLERNPQPDLILLDIQLSDGNSFTIFERVTVTAPIIFCTAYDHFALKAFKVNSVDYLLKPLQEKDLHKAVEKLQQRRPAPLDRALSRQLLTPPSYKPRFLVKAGAKLLSIAIDQIAFFFIQDKWVYLTTLQGKAYALDISLEEVESQVSPQAFFRANRQYLVGIRAVMNVETSGGRLFLRLQPDPGQGIGVSRERSSALKAWLDGC